MYIPIRLNGFRMWLSGIVAAVVLITLFMGFMNFWYPLKYLDIITKNAALYNLEPALVCAVIHAESKFAENALSHKGASGLMQVTEKTADWIAGQMDLPDYNYVRIFEPSLNISIGCKYLSWLLDRYNNTDLAITAYNAGSGNVDKWLKNAEFSSDGKRLEAIPFKETREYLRRVQINKRIYDFFLFGLKLVPSSRV